MLHISAGIDKIQSQFCEKSNSNEGWETYGVHEIGRKKYDIYFIIKRNDPRWESNKKEKRQERTDEVAVLKEKRKQVLHSKRF